MNELCNRALALIAGCPDGATEAALAAHGIPEYVLLALLKSGSIKRRVERLGYPVLGMTRVRYWVVM